MLSRKCDAEIIGVLNKIYDICQRHEDRLSTIEEQLEELNSKEKVVDNSKQEIQSLKDDIRENHKFIQEMLVMVVDRQVQLTPKENGKISVADHIRNKNASAVTKPLPLP